ncbi:hypothetical protein C789_733 [Microcystis aeruginosa FACHB-905 = DIANCHI905]|uniref:Uncharacterized protein n=1 Tax=Microcystis aeruginosa PCC 7806SL TaxID=1903187 RepID=A0AB33BJ58_MICA7|nr:hypothetical protein BH695_1371 [Microcystis aeruginosa PCC 7806SL]ELS49479.1 hypothetical protein C789_733 [Microcystis aeruginosa FACHB-905 = DIANCHI905]
MAFGSKNLYFYLQFIKQKYNKFFIKFSVYKQNRNILYDSI